MTWCQDQLKQRFHLPTPEYQQSTSKGWYFYMHSLSTFTSYHQFVLELSELRGSNWSANARVIICSLPPRCPAAPMRSIRSCELSWSSLVSMQRLLQTFGLWIHPEQRTKNKKVEKNDCFSREKKKHSKWCKKDFCVCDLSSVCWIWFPLCVYLFKKTSSTTTTTSRLISTGWCLLATNSEFTVSPTGHIA